jgi:hypothetical protein
MAEIISVRLRQECQLRLRGLHVVSTWCDEGQLVHALLLSAQILRIHAAHVRARRVTAWAHKSVYSAIKHSTRRPRRERGINDVAFEESRITQDTENWRISTGKGELEDSTH